MAQLTQTKKIVVVGDQLLSTGFRMAGVKETYIAHSGEQAEEVLGKLFERDDIGVLVVGEGISAAVKDRRIRYKLDNSIDPVVMAIPGYNEKETRADTLRNMIIRVIGIDIVNTDRTKR